MLTDDAIDRSLALSEFLSKRSTFRKIGRAKISRKKKGNEISVTRDSKTGRFIVKITERSAES